MAVFLILLSIAFILTYLWFQHKFSYWSRKGLDGPKPIFPYGNIRDVIKGKIQFFQPYCDVYNQFKHLPYVGMYSFYRPVLCVNDLEIAKHILIKDFDHFQSRGTYSGGVGDPLAENLFNIFGKPWRLLRLKMSPTFSSRKLKSMFPMVEGIANEARNYADLLHSNGEAINFSEFYGRYAMEIIANIGFGVECNGINNPDSEFFNRGREYFETRSWYWTLIRAFAFIAPDAFDKLRIKRISPRVENFFYGLVKQTVAYREEHGYKRNDFLQTLIELRNGQFVDEKGNVKHIHDFPFSMKDVAANTMVYMIAGYETSATTGQFAAYQLAQNPHIQDRVREEINTVLAKYNGECTYDAQNEMHYFNMVLDETMRMYPSMRALFRRCNKDYTIPNTNLVIEKGTLVFVPVQAIHMDPDMFPDPEKFDPDRFIPEKKAKLHPCQWMPFGEGPRKCLGVKQGYIQSKMALVKILQKYELYLDKRTAVPVKVNPSCLVCSADGGVWLRLKELNNNNMKALQVNTVSQINNNTKCKPDIINNTEFKPPQ